MRLADHLKEQKALRKPAASSKYPPTMRVAFIGGGHRVETNYAPALKALSDDVEVCGVVTRSSEGADRVSKNTGWSAGTDLHALLGGEKPDFLIAAVPPGEVDALYLGLVDLNIPLLLETPACWNERTGRRTLQKCDQNNFLVGVAEQFPFLPEFQLWRELISLGLIGRVSLVVNNFAVFDYHGISLLRSFLGFERRPVSAQANQHKMPNGEQWLMGTLTFDDGSFAVHNFAPEYELAAHRDVDIPKRQNAGWGSSMEEPVPRLWPHGRTDRNWLRCQINGRNSSLLRITDLSLLVWA